MNKKIKELQKNPDIWYKSKMKYKENDVSFYIFEGLPNESDVYLKCTILTNGDKAITIMSANFDKKYSRHFKIKEADEIIDFNNFEEVKKNKQSKITKEFHNIFK